MTQPRRRLVSTRAIHTPGILAFLRAFRARDLTPEAGDRAVCFYMVAQAFPDLTVCEIVKVVEGRYTVEGEDVILADAPEPTGGYGNYGDDGDDDDIPF